MKYFRKPSESELGVGWVYFEFEGDWARRQVEQYGECWYAADSPNDYHPDLGPGLVDQPLSELELTQEDEISREEFEEIWTQARGRQA